MTDDIRAYLTRVMSILQAASDDHDIDAVHVRVAQAKLYVDIVLSKLPRTTNSPNQE